jgi:hypothetical protein
VSAPVYLWEAGPSSGASDSLEGAQREAGERIAPGAVAVVEEAAATVAGGGADARGGGLLPGHERTGRAWLGRLADGEPSWQEAEVQR